MVRGLLLQARRVGHTLAGDTHIAALHPSNEWCAPAACPAWHCSHCRRRSPSLTRFRPRRRRLRLFSLSQWSRCSRHCASCDNPATTSTAPLFARVGYARRSSFNAVRPLAAGISSLVAPPASPSVPRPGTWPLAVRLSGSWQSRTLWLLAPRSCARRRRARRRSSRAVCSVRSSRGGKAVPNRSCCCSSS